MYACPFSRIIVLTYISLVDSCIHAFIHFCKITSTLIKTEPGGNIFSLRLLCYMCICHLQWLHPHKDDLSPHVSKAESGFLFYENEFQAQYAVSTHVNSIRNYALCQMLKSCVLQINKVAMQVSLGEG